MDSAENSSVSGGRTSGSVTDLSEKQILDAAPQTQVTDFYSALEKLPPELTAEIDMNEYKVKMYEVAQRDAAPLSLQELLGTQDAAPDFTIGGVRVSYCGDDTMVFHFPQKGVSVGMGKLMFAMQGDLYRLKNSFMKRRLEAEGTDDAIRQTEETTKLNVVFTFPKGIDLSEVSMGEFVGLRATQQVPMRDFKMTCFVFETSNILKERLVRIVTDAFGVKNKVIVRSSLEMGLTDAFKELKDSEGKGE